MLEPAAAGVACAEEIKGGSAPSLGAWVLAHRSDLTFGDLRLELIFTSGFSRPVDPRPLGHRIRQLVGFRYHLFFLRPLVGPEETIGERCTKADMRTSSRHFSRRSLRNKQTNKPPSLLLLQLLLQR